LVAVDVVPPHGRLLIEHRMPSRTILGELEVLQSHGAAVGSSLTVLLRKTRASSIVVALVAVVTYVMTLGYDFAFDDHYVIPPAWQVGAWSPIEVLKAPVRAGDVLLHYFRPVAALSYWLDGLVWQGNPGGFHLTNVALHVLVSLLVLAVARRLLPAGWAPLLAALLFAVHPVHVEAVAWVQGRVDLLSAAGILAAVLLAVTGMEACGRRTLLYGVASAAAFLFALLAKEVAVVTPLLTGVVLSVRAGRKSFPPGRQWLPLVGLQALVFILYLGLRTAALGSPALGLLGGPSVVERLLLALRVVPLYLRLLLLPVGLNPKHEVAPPSGLLDVNVLLGIALLTALAVMAFRWRRIPGLTAGLAWLVLAWLPASNLIPIRGFVVAERYLYLPSAGFCFALAGTAAFVTPLSYRWQRAAAAAVAALLFTLGGLAASQAGIWQDFRTFYEGLVRLNPDSAFAHNNLGSVYVGSGEDARAEAEFREALHLHPGHPGALNNLGLLAQRRGDLLEARRLYGDALAARPNQADVWNNLGTLYEAEGDVARATEAYGQAVRLDPMTAQFQANLADVLVHQGRRVEAAGLLERAIKLDPTVTRWRESLATLRGDRKP
jgi:protein O-mannosyl-transferase